MNDMVLTYAVSCDALSVVTPVDYGHHYNFLILTPVHHNIKPPGGVTDVADQCIVSYVTTCFTSQFKVETDGLNMTD